MHQCVQRASAALLPVDETVSDVFKASILDGMAHDKISFIVRQDKLRVVSRYDESGNKYKTPSLALKLGHSLKKCAQYTKNHVVVVSGPRVIS